jgi:hypothetical protein
MKRWTISLLTLAITIHIGAASKAAPKKVLTWKSIREKTTCEAVAPGSCIGEYGFKIDASGKFTAGPSPDGLHVQGALTPGELEKLQKAIEDDAAKGPNLPEMCTASRMVPGTSNRLTLTSRNGRDRVVYRRERPNETCFTGNRDTATKLHDVMQGLMAEHYPQHFPQ